MRLVSAMPRTEMLGDRCQVVRGRVQQCGARLPSLGFICSLALAWRGGAVLSVRADINLISSSPQSPQMPICHAPLAIADGDHATTTTSQ